GPGPEPLAVPPDEERVPSQERTGDHRDDGVVLDAPGTVDGEVPTRYSLDPVLFVERTERELARELGQTVHAVGVVSGRAGHVLREVEGLARIGLKVERVDAARGSVGDGLDPGPQRCGEERRIQAEVRGARVLVEIDVAAATVIGGEMERDIDTLGRSDRDVGITKVA